MTTLLAATAGTTAVAATALGDIGVIPERGQSAEQTRRDRYECHNWAVEQIGTVPGPGVSDDEERKRERAARFGRIIAGAGIGAALGGLIRGADDNRDADEGALGGAVLGAAAGAVIGRNRDGAEDETFDEYFRALGACMEGRGYELTVPGAADEV